MANCKCLEQAKEKLHNHLMQGVPEGSKIGGIFDGTGWDNEVMSFGKDAGIHVMLNYKLAFRPRKKNGELANNYTRKEVKLKMTYCPMCGEKLESNHEN